MVRTTARSGLSILLLTSCLSVTAASSLSAQGEDKVPPDSLLQAQVEQLWKETGVPGIAVALVEGEGQPLFAGAGYADIDLRIPVEPDTTFFLGSISKNIFATIALQLVDEGRLELDEPLSAFIEWPRGDEITVRMLLNHSSGIPEYLGSVLAAPEGAVPGFFSSPHSPAEIYGMMPSREPTFDPGTQQAYSNTNGLLVGTVLEKVTGRTLAELFQERIATPLRLGDSYLYTVEDRPRSRAVGYCTREGWVPEAGTLGDCSFADEALPASADGSVVASAPDLLRYHRALRGGELLSRESWEAMRRVEPGWVNGLGYLIMTGPMGDHEGNAGRSFGHISANVYYVDLDLFVVMLINQGDAALPMRRFLDLRYGEAGRGRDHMTGEIRRDRGASSPPLPGHPG